MYVKYDVRAPCGEVSEVKVSSPAIETVTKLGQTSMESYNTLTPIGKTDWHCSLSLFTFNPIRLWKEVLMATKIVKLLRLTLITFNQTWIINRFKQVHSLCVDSRPGDRLRLAKGDPPPSSFFFCQAQSEAHGPPSAMAVRKKEFFKLNFLF